MDDDNDSGACRFSAQVGSADGRFACTDRACAVCALRARAADWIQWCRAHGIGHRTAAAAISGIARCARLMASAAPRALAFYATATAIKMGVDALASRDSPLRYAADLGPLCRGHVVGLVCASAAVHVIASAKGAQRRRGVVGVASRLAHVWLAIGTTSYFIVSLAPHIGRAFARAVDAQGLTSSQCFRCGMAHGVVVSAGFAIVAISGVIVLDACRTEFARAKRALDRAIYDESRPLAVLEPALARNAFDRIDDLLLSLDDDSGART
ncbi:hypothetical protein [Pandoravirus japonicus]|uniref:Uncharacterized protein n=1 Tax=Pandoravirus japonicus TaxID=2823154 RepID=A0A811BMR6_9VIRU|nr:hypothetical protein [Pandoravirus japonicus]